MQTKTLTYLGLAPYSMAIAFADWLQNRDQFHTRQFYLSEPHYKDDPFARVDAKFWSVQPHPDYEAFREYVLQHVQIDTASLNQDNALIISGANSTSLLKYHQKIPTEATIFDVAKSTVLHNDTPTFPYLINPQAGYLCGWSQYEAIMQGNSFMLDVAHQDIALAQQLSDILNGPQILTTPSMYPLHGQVYGALKNIFGLVMPLIQQNHQLLDGHFENEMIDTLERITGDLILRYQLSEPPVKAVQGSDNAPHASQFINYFKTYYQQHNTPTFQQSYHNGALYKYAAGAKTVYDITFKQNNCPDVDARKSCSGSPKTRNYQLGEAVAKLFRYKVDSGEEVLLEEILQQFWLDNNITDGYIPEGVHALKSIPQFLSAHYIREQDSKLLLIIWQLILGEVEGQWEAYEVLSTNKLAGFLNK